MNENRAISPFSDLGFKLRFANEGHKGILAGLIRDFFGFEPKRIEIINPYNIKAYVEKLKSGEDFTVLRQTLRDVTARLETADFTAEVQVKRNRYYDRRSVFYGCSAFCGNYNKPIPEDVRIEAGDYSRYASLRPLFALNILEESYFGDEHPLRVFRLYDPERGLPFEPRYLNIGYFEPNKRGRDEDLTQNQIYWRGHLLGEPVPPEAPDYIREAALLLDYVNLTKEEREMIDLAEKLYEDTKAERITARLEGREEGREEANRKAARKMKAGGLSISEIAEYLGMNEQDVLSA